MVVRNYDADEALRSIGFSRRARTDADGWPVVTYEMDGPHHQRIEATCDELQRNGTCTRRTEGHHASHPAVHA